jgi:outer membrane protein OmpA-like peptidoglycan-associated protein
MLVDGSETLGKFKFDVKFHFNYAENPLLLERDGSSEPVIDYLLNSDLQFSIGLLEKYLQLGLSTPFVAYIKGVRIVDNSNLSSTGIGDIRMLLKSTLLDRNKYPFGIAFLLNSTFPTGDEHDFSGDGFLTCSPEVALDFRRGKILAGINLGFLVRRESDVLNLDIGNEFQYSAAVAYNLKKPRMRIGAEISGAMPLSMDVSEEELPVEAMLGIRMQILRDMALEVGAGAGLTRGYATPLFRIIFGVIYMPRVYDSDGDGLYDENDRCPNQKEDVDGFMDLDGCPDPDNDRDGILDIEDRCPSESEDRDGFDDNDGCPDVDNDGDGLSDEDDRCPMKPEDKDGVMDDNGCPDIDTDGDGFDDTLDKCPADAEDVDEFEDEDGCPDPDNDGDGIMDDEDGCPFEPEDYDQFKDEDGCPDVDNDEDGILDEKDSCPEKPETMNGYRDEDGCPDESKVILKDDRIDLLEKIHFLPGKAVILPDSYTILDQIIEIIKAHPEIKRIRIEGHTDNVGSKKKNKILSQKRADAVKEYFVKMGIDPAKLKAIGYGEERPVATNLTPSGRAANRRVEFRIEK